MAYIFTLITACDIGQIKRDQEIGHHFDSFRFDFFVVDVDLESNPMCAAICMCEYRNIDLLHEWLWCPELVESIDKLWQMTNNIYISNSELIQNKHWSCWSTSVWAYNRSNATICYKTRACVKIIHCLEAHTNDVWMFLFVQNQSSFPIRINKFPKLSKILILLLFPKYRQNDLHLVINHEYAN